MYRDQISASSCQVCLLSAEHFWSCLGSRNEILALKDRFFRIGLSVSRIVVYLRRQSSWFESFQHQRVREGRGLLASNAADLLNTPTARQLDYSRLIDTWGEVFRGAQIIPRIFESSSLMGRGILDDFFDAAGLPVINHSAEVKNSSALSNLGINLMLSVRALLESQNKGPINNSSWRRLTAEIAKNMHGRCMILPEEEMCRIDRAYAESNELVRLRYFPERSSLFLGDSLHAVERFERLEGADYDSIVRLVTALWQRSEK
ncbi:hypothetical protein [Roseivivax isoporae]|uniref:hypothetical protein n=1 Tax=Roseivivax isoporae TaxID=591206 RepID=UPI0012EB4D3F|nr:hypothetical protein [Roseivivax isoporae]